MEQKGKLGSTMRSTSKKSTKRRPSPVYITIGLIFIIFIIYWLIIINYLPTWSERGLFGDTFGALNVLVSGVALIGVVYALYIQQRQLNEMRRSIELQQQPVVAIDVSELVIDRPSVFTSPTYSTFEALSRFHCLVSLSIVTEMPAVNLVVNASAVIPHGDGREEIKSVGAHFPLLTSVAPVKENILLIPEESYTGLFQALRKKDAFALPSVTIELVYQNFLGACFAVKQGYNVVASEDIDEDLKSWHTAISSFTTEYQEDLTVIEKKGKDMDSLNRIKSRFVADLGEKEQLSLDLIGIPGAFDAGTITREQYDGFLNSVGLPRLTFSHTTCPIDDSTK